jgi:hypothetical protein
MRETPFDSREPLREEVMDEEASPPLHSAIQFFFRVDRRIFRTFTTPLTRGSEMILQKSWATSQEVNTWKVE